MEKMKTFRKKSKKLNFKFENKKEKGNRKRKELGIIIP